MKVIDDGSTDSTAKILEHYNRIPQLQIIRQTNKGFSGARNTGLKNIDARYVMFLDSDDKLAPGAIQALLEMADKTGADIVEGSSIKFCGPIITKNISIQTSKKQMRLTYEALLGEKYTRLICLPACIFLKATGLKIRYVL